MYEMVDEERMFYQEGVRRAVHQHASTHSVESWAGIGPNPKSNVTFQWPCMTCGTPVTFPVDCLGPSGISRVIVVGGLEFLDWYLQKNCVDCTETELAREFLEALIADLTPPEPPEWLLELAHGEKLA